MVRVVDEADWIVIGDAADRPGVAFQRVQELPPTIWPGNERPQYRHFDVAVRNLDDAERKALSIGARRLEGGGNTLRVFADPAGHPFCLVTV